MDAWCGGEKPDEEEWMDLSEAVGDSCREEASHEPREALRRFDFKIDLSARPNPAGM